MENNILKELSKFDTATLSDALDGIGYNGGLIGIKPQNLNNNITGIAYPIKYRNVSKIEFELKNPANFIDDVPLNHIPILDNNGRIDCTVWGDILTEVAMKRGIQGVIINGCCRDIASINKHQFNLFSKDVFMQSGKGRTCIKNINTKIKINNVEIRPGDYIRGDENGVVVIPQEKIKTIIRYSKIITTKEDLIKKMVKKDSRLDEIRKNVNYSHAWEELK
ncbi:RraA family protein [Staphylococcus sp. EZ-P03]|uniref:RraA family protein n=1 Tax=Staphylococcus sp. EZ-P03 TaxID=2282739 RepID=UPI000DF81060|nr:RraA family protein [Staphylococcus sp. EZ-P03]